jgi:Carboxypeptidase regulatory-like domain
MTVFFRNSIRIAVTSALCASLWACQTADMVTPNPVSSAPDAGVSSANANQGSQASLSQGVSGRVTTGDGRPVAGVMVSAQAVGAGSPPVPELAVMTAADGRFEWPLQPGTYDLSATTQNGATGSQRVSVGTGMIVANIIIR